MKTLGVLGGMSWESTLVYYRAINQGVARRHGALHSAPLLLHSFDFEGIAALQRRDAWGEATDRLVNAALGLKAAGAAGLLIATNTMHKLAVPVQAATGLPLLHIGDAIGAAVRAAGLDRVGLLGTRFTMEQGFLREHLADHHGVATLVPDEADRAAVHRVIFEELCRGIVSAASRTLFLDVIERLRRAGAQGVVLGCTEIGLLLDADALPFADFAGFDSTLLHAEQAVAWIGAAPSSSGDLR